MNKNDDKFNDFSRQLLDKSLDDLDDSVLSRLRQSRQMAINAASLIQQNNANANSNDNTKENENSFSFPTWLVPASTGAAFATIALSITLFWTQPQFRETVHQSIQQTQDNGFLEDMNLLSQNEDLELYQNLEFYLWLEDEETS